MRKDVVLTTRGTVGNVVYYDDSVPYPNVRINSGMLILRSGSSGFEGKYLVEFFLSDIGKTQIKNLLSGSAQPQLPIRVLVDFLIPKPPLLVQEKLVSNIQKERDLILANQSLITMYENKIKQVIARVWESE